MPTARSIGRNSEKRKRRTRTFACLSVLVVRPLSGRTARQADYAADERNEQSLEEKRDDDAESAEADRAHGGDFAGALGDGGIHGVERAEHRADAHDDSNQGAQDGDQGGEAARLLLVVIELAVTSTVRRGSEVSESLKVSNAVGRSADAR